MADDLPPYHTGDTRVIVLAGKRHLQVYVDTDTTLLSEGSWIDVPSVTIAKSRYAFIEQDDNGVHKIDAQIHPCSIHFVTSTPDATDEQAGQPHVA